MNNLAILASGSGSNAEAIVKYFNGNPSIRVVCIISNKPEAGVLLRAKNLGIPAYTFNNEEMRTGQAPLELLRQHQANIIALAGYLNLITEPWLTAFPRRIINLHPALLPRYGGKGMYGHHVHRAVLANGEEVSGITIHLVDEQYDHGLHLLQTSCPVLPSDNVDTLVQRIHSLEHRYYPMAIEQYIVQLSEIEQAEA